MENSEELKKLNNFEKIIKFKFKDIDILKNSLVHRSYLNEISDKNFEHNERLEFLGDAVLELIITEYLYSKYPKFPEGELTSFRAAVVRTESLAETASKLKIGEHIYISKGEELTGGRNKPYILANTFESLLGAIYLDSGFEEAKKFVQKNLIPKISNIVENRSDIDSKSKLQELSQEKFGITPSYALIDSEGPDHDKVFTMQTRIGDITLGSGKGKSKQLAEQNAASSTLEDWDNVLKHFESLRK